MRKGTSRTMHFFICGLAYESVSFILTRKNETTTERIQSCLYTPLKLIFPKRRETKKQAEKTTTSWSKGEPKKCTARIGKTQTDRSCEVRMDRSKNRSLIETISHWRHPCVWWAFVHELDFNKTWGIFSSIFFNASARKEGKEPFWNAP